MDNRQLREDLKLALGFVGIVEIGMALIWLPDPTMCSTVIGAVVVIISSSLGDD